MNTVEGYCVSDEEMREEYLADLVSRYEEDRWDIEATELQLFIENDYDAYTNLVYTLKNLRKHFKRGNFDTDKALKGLSYPVKRGAMSYSNQFCSAGNSWFKTFPVKARELTAVYLLQRYVEDICCDDDKDYMNLDEVN